MLIHSRSLDQGLGFRVLGFGFWVLGLGFRVLGLGVLPGTSILNPTP